MKTLVSGLKRREEITKSWLIVKLFFKLRFPAGKCRLNNNDNDNNNIIKNNNNNQTIPAHQWKKESTDTGTVERKIQAAQLGIEPRVSRQLRCLNYSFLRPSVSAFFLPLVCWNGFIDVFAQSGSALSCVTDKLLPLFDPAGLLTSPPE